ncbi:MAG: cytochrome c biogenesis CcdA family protein [Candidatus Saccharibacteria bacterium]
MLKSKKIIVLLFLIAALLAVAILFRGASGSAWITRAEHSSSLFFPLVTVAAVIDSINPCAFSVLLLTIAFLVSLNATRGNIIRTGGAYVFGVFLVYILIGLGILQALSLFHTPNFMAKVGAVIIIGVGVLNLINEFFPSFPIKLKIPRAAHPAMAKLMEKASLPTAFVLGGFVGMVEFPCTGGPYLLILGMLHDAGTKILGLAWLTYYNFIFVLPLLLILFLASDKKILGTVEQWRKGNGGGMRLYGGLAAIALGVIMLIL